MNTFLRIFNTLFFLLTIPLWACTKNIQFPKPLGPYSVGYKNLELVDTKRRDPYEPSSPRRLKVTVYYPSNERSKQEPYGAEKVALWKRRMTMLLTSKDMPEKFRISNKEFDSFIQEVASLQVFQCLDAPWAPGEFPIILFEHGYSETTASSRLILQDLVSHGYVVVTIGHPSTSGSVIFQDGTEAIYKPIEFQKHAFKITFDDAQFILGQLSKIKKLVPSVNLKKVGLIGHGLGGGISVKITRLNPLIKAGVSLDAPFVKFDHKNIFTRILEGFKLDTGSQLSKPFLFVVQDDRGRSGNNLLPHNTKIDLGPQSFKAVIKGAGHYSFADQSFLLNTLRVTKNRKKDFEEAPNLSFDEPQIFQLIRTFFDKFLKDQKVDLMKLKSTVVILEAGKNPK